MTADDGEDEQGYPSAEPVGAAGRRVGRSARDIAVALYGAANAGPEWNPDGPMRAVMRRLVHGAANGAGRGLPARR